MLKRFQRNSASNRLIEEKLYEEVLIEMGGGDIRTGLWAKALANGNGSEEKAKGLYIKYRVQSIKDEFTIIEEYFEMKEKEEIERQQVQIIEKEPSINKIHRVYEDYYELEYFSEDSGFSIELSEKLLEEGLYPGKKIDGKWYIHKSAISKEFLEINS